MYGMAKLKLCIGGHLIIEEEMNTLVESYSLTDCAMYICRMGPIFQEPINDDDATAYDKDEAEDDGNDDDNDNADIGYVDMTLMDVDFATNVATAD